MDQHHGVISRAQLLKVDYSAEEIRKFVASGTLEWVRRGWYAAPVADPQVVRAVKAGGALSCVSALRLLGLWAPKRWPDDKLHVRRSRYFQLHGRMPSGIPHCPIPGDLVASVHQSVDPLPKALAAAVGCLPAEAVIALLDSALNKQLITEDDLALLPLGDLSRRTDAEAQSGTESLVRQRLRAKGIKLRTQVQIKDIGWVDILVGDRLVIEVDSMTFHHNPEAFAKDRARDRRLVARGYVVIRVTYEEVMYFWSLIEPDLLAVIREGRHRWPRRAV